MSGGGGSSSNSSSSSSSAPSTTASLTPIDVGAMSMRTPSSETAKIATTHDNNGYYVPPSAIYANMFGQNPGYYVNDTPRSNYDPSKALALAEQARVYQNKSAADLATGYNASISGLAAQRQAVIDKQAADKAAAEEARLRAQMGGWGNLFGQGGTFAAAQGGLASLEGFKR